MITESEIDISENTLRTRGRILDILLIDRARHKPSRPHNIIWGTDSYEKLYLRGYGFKKQIKIEQITGLNGKLIRPRAAKSKEEQKYRTKEKAEVFTRLKNVKEMNLVIDRASKNWPVSQENWVAYISELRLEITCGEASFIAGRYDPTANTGTLITPKKRVGFFDRKLQVINEFVNGKKKWLQYAEVALKATYGYEWQGDNLLIARENILQTLDDFYEEFCANKLNLKSKQNLTDVQLELFAEIISWNIWQMDGLKYVIPLSCRRTMKSPVVTKGQTSLLPAEKPYKIKVECEGCRISDPYKHSGKYVKISDWQANKKPRFVDLMNSDHYQK